MGIGKTLKATGYIAPDFTLRCPKCSVGKDNVGHTIGAVIAEQRVICQLEPGKSVLVATVGRCCKPDKQFWPDGKKMPDCNALSHFKMKPDGYKLRLTQANIMACCQQSKGNLFNLAELESGQVGINGVTPRPTITAQPEKLYDPNKFTEQNIDVPF